MRPFHQLSTLAVLAAVLGAAAPASAAQRYASPTSNASTPCTSAAPCGIVPAINAAGAGDEVIVTPGTYSVSTPLGADHAIDIHGVAGQPRPRLTGTANLSGTTLTLENGETASHLEIRSTSMTHNALQIKGLGAHAERLVVWSGKAHAAKLVPSAGTTELHDSLVETAGGAADVSALKLSDGAIGETMVITNVTASATNGVAIGIRCEAVKSTTVIRNTVARGVEHDIEANAGCTVESSNFRTAFSPGATGTGNQGGDPLFGDDFFPEAGSPLVDAGTSSGSLGTLDLAGRSRTLGADPDIGAYERDGAASVADPASAGPPAPSDLMPVAETPADDEPTETTEDQPEDKPADEPDEKPADKPVTLPTPGLPAAPAILLAQPRGLSELPAGVTPPVVGRTATVAPASGTVLIKTPNGTYRKLEAGDAIPLGTTIDATRGVVTLSTALGGDRGFQTGTFSGGRFEVRQPTGLRGMTDIVLRGGDFSKCPKRKRTTATAAAKRKPVRRLWGSDRNGRFRTKANGSIATVRGTRWLTEDYCDGTLTKVTEGAVDVRELRTGKTTRVKAGGQKLIRTAR